MFKTKDEYLKGIETRPLFMTPSKAGPYNADYLESFQQKTEASKVDLYNAHNFQPVSASAGPSSYQQTQPVSASAGLSSYRQAQPVSSVKSFLRPDKPAKPIPRHSHLSRLPDAAYDPGKSDLPIEISQEPVNIEDQSVSPMDFQLITPSLKRHQLVELSEAPQRKSQRLIKIEKKDPTAFSIPEDTSMAQTLLDMHSGNIGKEKKIKGKSKLNPYSRPSSQGKSKTASEASLKMPPQAK